MHTSRVRMYYFKVLQIGGSTLLSHPTLQECQDLPGSEGANAKLRHMLPLYSNKDNAPTRNATPSTHNPEGPAKL